ncbi:MAG: hypothetical protein QF718_01215 [Phycisphaerales bacterium]|jgi:hypothetical protein|nr:hypothetical protein [Phycisphaerales bacterium]
MTAESKPKSPIASDLTQMRVALSLQCSRCGYDIRNLAADGDCPECGKPIRLTIIEVVDPTTQRLEPIHNQKLIANSIFGIVFFYFLSTILAVLVLVTTAPDSLPIPDSVRQIPQTGFMWISSACGFVSLLNLVPIIKMCKSNKLHGCKQGIAMTFLGLAIWSVSMILIAIVLLSGQFNTTSVTMILEICVPVIAAALVFSGFRKLVPRLGQRSRAFRQAQGSRQRMNDLLAALVVVIIGRVLIAVSPEESNLSMFGLIITVMSLTLIVVGLGYLLRNVLWIRKALITPPPALTELLRPISP